MHQLDRRNKKSEAIIWNLSGSTLLHIVIILGLGFYVTLPEPVIPERTLSINLVADTKLSAKNQLGQGEQAKEAISKPAEQQAREILHTDQHDIPLDKNSFQLTPKKLIEEIRDKNNAIRETERVGFLGVINADPSYRQYQQYWQQYVSEFGTRNYPRDLLEKNLNGSLELDIVIDKQGNVRSAKIYRSSGNQEIDRAAVRIANQAGPYKPLPEEMASELDILHIVRTWEFNNNTLTSHAASK